MNLNSPAMRLGGRHQAYLYATAVLLVLSGALWLLFHYFVRIPGEFGERGHALEPWWMVVHGVSAAAFLVGFGTVLPGHVRRAWSAHRNRISGSSFFGVLAILALTGYALYYTGDESARAVVSVLHWVLGLGAPLLMGWHVWRGRAWRRIKAETAPSMEATEPEAVVRLMRKS